MSDWVRAAAVDDIRDGGARSFAYAGKRIALFRTPRGLFACDNRCPHQGYALVRGDVNDGALTCAWHNWKFELGTGTCRYGGENIRTYPVQVRDGQVFVDIADPPAEIIRPDLRAEGIRAAGSDRLAGSRCGAVSAGARDGARHAVRQAAVHAQVPAGVAGGRA